MITTRSLLGLVLVLTFTVYVASESCNYDGYRKGGCFKRNEELFHELLITDLDPTHDKWGKDVDWANFQEAIRSLACRCEAKSRSKGFSFFAIGFYGECWAGKNDTALAEKILNPGSHASSQCVGGDYGICDRDSKNECAGVEDNEYVYEVVQVAGEEFVRATADFSQTNVPGVQYHVNGRLLDNGNFIFLWRNGGFFKMVLTTNDGTIIKSGYLKDPGTTWKEPSTWTDNTGFYTVSKFKGLKDTKEDFVGATADFRQVNVGGVQLKGVKGRLLDNGNFIFLWRNDGFRKMVLTTNDGTIIKSGYLKDPGTTWKDPNTWIDNTGFYSVLNFNGLTDAKEDFASATADFSQANLAGLKQQQGLQGHLLDNRNFIFLWRNGIFYKMVLTKNDGTIIKAGYLRFPATTWKDPNTWIDNKDFYSVSNFKGVKASSVTEPPATVPPFTEKPVTQAPLTEEVVYKYSSVKKTWADAEKDCNQWGGHLATITNKQENDQHLKEMRSRKGFSNAWIGLSDTAKEGRWVWKSTNTQAWFTYWNRGEPNNYRNKNEDCTHMFLPSGLWNDLRCSSKLPFICQKVKAVRTSGYFDLSRYIGKVVRFTSTNYPGRMVRHRGHQLWLDDKSNSQLYHRDSSFLVVKGLAGRGVSLQSVNFPSRYIRHRGFLLYTESGSTNLFRNDATFIPRSGLIGGNTMSLESVNYPGYFIRHQGFRLKLHKNDGSSLFKKDASWTYGAKPWIPKYVYEPRAKTYSEAEKDCKSRGGRLASVSTPHVNDELFRGFKTRPGLKPYVFVGLNDIAKEGQWVLAGSNSAATYTNWRRWKNGGEPNGGRKENCLMMYADNGQWNDISCSRKLPYVCERA